MTPTISKHCYVHIRVKKFHPTCTCKVKTKRLYSVHHYFRMYGLVVGEESRELRWSIEDNSRMFSERMLSQTWRLGRLYACACALLVTYANTRRVLQLHRQHTNMGSFTIVIAVILCCIAFHYVLAENIDSVVETTHT